MLALALKGGFSTLKISPESARGYCCPGNLRAVVAAKALPGLSVICKYCFCHEKY